MTKTPTSSPGFIPQEVGASYRQGVCWAGAINAADSRAGRVRHVRHHQTERSAGLTQKCSGIFPPKLRAAGPQLHFFESDKVSIRSPGGRLAKPAYSANSRLTCRGRPGRERAQQTDPPALRNDPIRRGRPQHVEVNAQPTVRVNGREWDTCWRENVFQGCPDNQKRGRMKKSRAELERPRPALGRPPPGTVSGRARADSAIHANKILLH